MASTMCGYVGVSGSPMPSEITSIPAAFLSATLRSSSANMYGGIASRRCDGSVRPMAGVRLSKAPELAHEFPRHLPLENRLRRPGQGHVQVVGDFHGQPTSVKLDRDRAGRSFEERS